MDFLKIRKKAKEHARDRGAAGASPAPAPAPADPARPDAAAPPDAPVVRDEDLLAGALAARLQGLPAPEAAELPETLAAADDPRFTTWRPGTGAPPVLEPPPASPPRPAPAAEAPAPRPAPEPPPSARVAARPIVEAPPPPPADPLEEFFFRDGEAAPALPEMAPEERPQAPAALAREEFLTFLLGEEEYAVAIGRVREVVRAPPITEVPRAPAHILGVVTVRGEVVAVLDPRRRLGLAPAQPAEGEGKVVIVDAGEGPCGLHVDRVASVVRLRPGSIEPCPQGIAGQRGEYLAGIGREGDRLFTVLDLPALLRRAPARSAGRAGRADGAA